jgi:hypothetical protein
MALWTLVRPCGLDEWSGGAGFAGSDISLILWHRKGNRNYPKAARSDNAAMIGEGIRKGRALNRTQNRRVMRQFNFWAQCDQGVHRETNSPASASPSKGGRNDDCAGHYSHIIERVNGYFSSDPLS